MERSGERWRSPFRQARRQSCSASPSPLRPLYPSQQVETIGVLGAGLMGAGIAEVSIGKNLRVLMKDKDQAGLFRAGRT